MMRFCKEVLGMKLTKHNYMLEVENGYVVRRTHPDNNNIVILNYTPKTIYERRWNDITLQCRGLILNEKTGEIVAKPFSKFFNYGENSRLDIQIPSSKPEITVKYDGSLGICYRLNNKLLWATRGSFTSNQAIVAQQIWEEKYNDKKVPNELTLLVEIIHPITKVVVNYDFIDLVLIGAVNRFTGYDYNYDELLAIAKEVGVPITEKINLDLQSVLDKIKTLDHTQEGFVLRWNDGFRLKVKSDEYLRVHKIVTGMSEESVLEFWVENNLEELIISLPEEFRQEIEDIKQKYNKILLDIKNEIYYKYNIAPKENRKEFAIWVNKNIKRYSHLMFKMFDNKLSDKDIKEIILKSYKEELS